MDNFSKNSWGDKISSLTKFRDIENQIKSVRQIQSWNPNKLRKPNPTRFRKLNTNHILKTKTE